MKTILRSFLLALAASTLALCARAEPLPPRSEGKVLILESGRTLEGDIEYHGTQFRIRRPAGEVWVPAEPGMRLCADWNEAFVFMRSQANQLDPDERVRLARWCQLHRLREQALAEVRAALRMQPGHREAQQMRDALERSLAENSEKGASGTPFPLVTPKPVLDISSEAVALFTTRVQPILMNTCVSCHSGEKAGRFQLYRTYDGGQRVATLKNVAAVLPLVNAQNPELSPLLIKAVSPHGANAQAPLRKESVPYFTLQGWVLQLLATNPQLRERREMLGASEPRRASMSKVIATNATAAPVWPSARKTGESEALPALFTSSTKTMTDSQPTAKESPLHPTGFAAPNQETSSPAVSTPSSFSDARPMPPAEPLDPFDPVLFNRQASPPQ